MAEDTKDAKQTELHDTLLELAKKRFALAEAAEAETRSDALEDLRFAEGEQWPDAMRLQRQQEGRPCLTMNRMPQFVQQITGEQRQNPVTGTFDPVGNADSDTADVLVGLARHIENQSNADEAYSNAFDYAVKSGWGWWRVATDYADEFSFEQEIYIKRIENPFSVYIDPSATEGDASDANWGFVTGNYTREAYEERFPKSDYATADANWRGNGDGWVAEGNIRVVEYFYREMREEEIVQMSDGQVYLERVLPKVLPDGLTIKQRRTTQVPFVKWALINNLEVLEEREWAGKWIPLVRIVGQMTNIDGKRIFKGIVRDGKDAQMSRNLRETALTEAIASTPKMPFIVTPKMIAGHEGMWKTMATKNRPFVYVNEPNGQSINGGLPYRASVTAPIQELVLATRQSDDDLKATSGIYDAALGAGSNDVSGRAINARQQQSQVATFHFADNLKRSIKQTYRILGDLIPYVYNTQRVVRIIREDGTQDNVTVNAKPDAQGQLPPGVDKIYDLTAGKYAVTISTGPSYQTKRQEAVDTQLNLMKVVPNAASLIADIVVGNMDIPGNRQIADRLKTLLPAPIQALEQKQVNVPPEFAQQMAQLQSQLQQAQQVAQQAQTDLKYGLSGKQMEIASREQVEREKIAASITIAEIAAHSAMANADAKREMDLLMNQIGQAHEVGMSAMEHGQAQEQQKAAEPTQ